MLSYKSNACTLPEVVMKWAGLTSDNPSIAGNGSLAGKNDEGTPFPEIAKLIEANL